MIGSAKDKLTTEKIISISKEYLNSARFIGAYKILNMLIGNKEEDMSYKKSLKFLGESILNYKFQFNSNDEQDSAMEYECESNVD